MNVRRLVAPAVGILSLLATQALALPANAPLTVRLCTVSASGTLTPVQDMPVTSDGQGKVKFSFTGCPTSDSTPILMVQVLDASKTVLRQGMVPAPAPNGAVKMGVGEVSDRQSRAMLSSLGQSGNGASMAAQMMHTLETVRSGAMTDHDATAMGPMIAAAANAFESYMGGAGGASASQMTALRTAMLDRMRDVAAACQQAVEVSDGTPAGDQTAAHIRADAMANFMDDLMNAAADAGVSLDAMQGAFDHAGSAAQSMAANMDDPSVMGAMGSVFRSAAQVRQMMAQQRHYADAMTMLGAPADQMQQMNSASASLTVDMTHAQEHYEEMFASGSDFPTEAQIQASEAAMAAAMDTAFQTYLQGTEASGSTVSAMLTTMASGMSGMGGGMGGMTGQTLQTMGIGMMVETPGGAAENWPVMMTSGANFMNSGAAMTYTPSTTALKAQLTLYSAPAAPDFSKLSGSYQAMMELQYDLLLCKFLDLQAVAAAGTPVSQAMLETMQDQSRARREQMMANVGGLTGTQRDAMVAAMSEPEMWEILHN